MAALWAAGVFSASAYVPLESVGGVRAGEPISAGSYLASIYQTGIAIAGVLAVLMIVVGGVQYISSGISPSAKEDAKSRITSALLGLLLALISWIILNTINPTLLNSPF